MFLNIEGTNVYYEIIGQGKPVILLHGWGCNTSTFKPLIQFLQKDYMVFALDFPGFGKSDIPESPWDVGNYSAFLKKFMEKICLKKADIIAHSFGGRVAIKLAAEQPELVNKLILVSSAGIKPCRTFKYYFKTILAKIGKVIAKILGPPGDKIKNWIYHHIASQDFQSAGPMRKTFIKIISEDLYPLLKKILAPTLLIWGEKDMETPVYMGKKMEREISDAGLVIFKNAGHYSYLEQFQNFCIIINNFLQSNPDNRSMVPENYSKSTQVKKMFSSIAHRYDLLNCLLSCGRDKYWRRYAINQLNLMPGEKYIDVAAGTGDMAIEIVKRGIEGTMVAAVDFSRNMVSFGEKKIKNLHFQDRVKFQLAESRNLPFHDNSFHSAVCAFGVRNFSNVLEGIIEMKRVIKKNGKIVILEFFKPKNRTFRFFYYFYFKKMLPFIGGIISGKHTAYKYLPDSVINFYTQEELMHIMKKAGLKNINSLNLTFGIVSLHIGHK